MVIGCICSYQKEDHEEKIMEYHKQHRYYYLSLIDIFVYCHTGYLLG